MKTIQERLESKTLPPNANGCRIYTGSPSNRYPQIRVEGSRLVSVHRLSYMVNVGPIPKGKSVLHHCDASRCIEPSHLHTGTPAENSAEMVARSRQSKRHGSKNTRAKLTEKKVITIRKHAALGWSQGRLSEKYKVSRSAISLIVSRHAWPHVK